MDEQRVARQQPAIGDRAAVGAQQRLRPQTEGEQQHLRRAREREQHGLRLLSPLLLRAGRSGALKRQLTQPRQPRAPQRHVAAIPAEQPGDAAHHRLSQAERKHRQKIRPFEPPGNGEQAGTEIRLGEAARLSRGCSISAWTSTTSGSWGAAGAAATCSPAGRMSAARR